MNNYYNSYCNPCCNRNYVEPYLGLDTIGLSWKKDCNDDVNKVKTVCDTEISNRNTQISELKKSIDSTELDCQNGFKMKESEIRKLNDDVKRLNSDIAKLKTDIDNLKNSCDTRDSEYKKQISAYATRVPIYEQQIRDYKFGQTSYENDIKNYKKKINAFDDRKKAYCQPIPENFRYY